MANTGLKETLRNALEISRIYKNSYNIRIGKRKKDDHIDKIVIKEENVKIKMVLPILKALGWGDGYMEDVEFEYSCLGKRVDCCLFEKDLKVFIELKACQANKTEKEKKEDVDDFKKYFRKDNVRYGVLTDGKNWEFYIKLCEFGSTITTKGNPKIIDSRNRRIDNDHNNVFKEYLSIEKANCMFGKDASILDEIWNDSFTELIKSCDADSCIDVLANRLKYEMKSISKSVKLKIEDRIFREYVERKIKTRKIEEEKNYIGIYRGIFSNDFDKNSLDEIKEHVISFVQKLGWQIEFEKGFYSDEILLVLKLEDKPVSLILVKVFARGRRKKGKKEDEKYLLYKCENLGILYGAVTNGIIWEFYEFKLKKEYSCCQFKEVKLEEGKIEQVADFLSMFSKDTIDNLPDMVTSSRVLDCILSEEGNQELKEEVLMAKENNEKMEELAKKLCDIVRGMKPDIAEDVLVEYLKSYIRWYGTENTIKEKSKKPKEGKLSVVFHGEPIYIGSAKDVYIEVMQKIIEEIGVEKVYKYRGKKGGKLLEMKPNGTYDIKCGINTERKKYCLEEIKKEFGLDLQIN